MPTRVGIMNKALRLLGQSEIASPDATQPGAVRCNSAWVDVVDEVLRAHGWKHATEWTSLALLEAAPPFGYSRAYRRPVDCLRIIDVRESGDLSLPGAPFEVAGDRVFTNASPCYARWVKRTADPTFWPPDFAEAVAARLAAEVASALTSDGGGRMAATMLQRYELALDRAVVVDETERTAPEPDEAARCSYLTARR